MVKERYAVMIYTENNKRLVIKEGDSNINKFFDKLFHEFPDAEEFCARKLYNPLFSDTETDDGRTIIARVRDSQLHGKGYTIKEKEEEIFFPRDEDPEEILD